LIDRSHPGAGQFVRQGRDLCIVRRNDQDVAEPEGSIRTLLIGPGRLIFEQRVYDPGHAFNFLRGLALIADMVDSDEAQTAAIKESSRINALVAILGPRPEAAIVEDFGRISADIRMQSPGLREE